MERTRRVRSTTLALALLAGPLALTATPSSAATGPATTDAGYTFAVRLDIGTGSRACSGALIAPQWIATAASCFSDSGGTPQAAAGKPKWKTTATIGRTDLTGTAGQVREVVELVPREGRDLVLARLATPTTDITPIPFAKTAPAAGDELTVAGFGRTADEWAPTKLHTATYRVDSVGGTTLGISGKTAADSICAGDAGGPVVRPKGSGYELVALSSQSWQGGCFGQNPTETRNGAISSRLDNITGGSQLAAGTTLVPGDTLTSNSARLTMQADGNLTVGSNAGEVLWSTGTAGHPGATARFGDDGDLAVLAADGSTVLWDSKTSAAGGRAVLQDRGNFVIYNAKGESQWAAGTVVRHDYTGDGRSDMADWYDYGDGHDSLHTFLTNPEGTFQAPKTAWTTPAGNWSWDHVKATTGDYNGDGVADVAAAYGYADGSVALYTWLGNPDGSFRTPFKSWNVAAGSWSFANMTLNSGDFNGDGRDDVSVWYDYSDGHDTLWTFTAAANGGFNAPFNGWTTPAGNWTHSSGKTVTGDFNGDGRDDLAVFYGYADDSVKLWTFTATAAGGFNSPAASWSSSTWGDWSRTSLHSGDFNGDGRDDVAAWYDYSDGHDAVRVFPSSTTGTFGSNYEAWSTPAGNMWRQNMHIVTGDFNGDGRDDLGALYGYADGRVKTFTWTTGADGHFGPAVGSWEAPAGNWTFDRAHFVERYGAVD
ncbi:FG-GAP-like repeat-containing protein [Streptomyces sp. NPDC005236]|uniref:FG-GAP-like repeat-containing protein n=1 Tax=Streptomyces sp. NPDC005236 TaxID=3157028 RepID=UPI0033B871A9